MNSINSVSKYKYSSKIEYPINLDEYVVVYDEALNERYLILKFFNTLTENAHHLDCNLKLYNENNFMVENIDFSFDGDFNHGYFIPELKLKINNEFSGIKLIIKNITFDTLYFEKNKLNKIPQKLIVEENDKEEINNQSSPLKKSKWQNKKDKLEYKTTKKDIVAINKRRYVTKADNVNKTRIGIVLTCISSILVLAYFISTLIIYSQTTKLLFDGKLYYTKNGSEVEVVSSIDDIENIVIPTTVDDLPVTRIDREFMVNSSTLRSITFNGNIIIEASAFKGCNKLSKINNPEFIKEIHDYAFKDTQINEFDFVNIEYLGKDALPESDVKELYYPNLTLRNKCLENFTSLTKITFKDIADGAGLRNCLSSSSIDSLKTIVTSDSYLEDYEVIKTNVKYIYLTNSKPRISVDGLSNGDIKVLGLTMNYEKLSTITGISNNQKAISCIQIDNVSSMNSDFFDEINVDNIAINADVAVSNIKLPTTVKTIYFTSNVRSNYLTNSYIMALRNRCPNLTDIYFESSPSVTSSLIQLHKSYSYDNYINNL